MKKNYIYIAVLLFAVVTANAQKKAYNGDINIVSQELRQDGKDLIMKFLVDASNAKVAKRQSVDFTPLLISNTHKVELPAVSVKGRNNDKVTRRKLALMGKKSRAAYEATAPYAIVKGYGSKDRMTEYSQKLPYEPWMDDARLDVIESGHGCGKVHYSDVRDRIAGVDPEKVIVIPPYKVTPQYAYVQPVAEAIKRREVQNESYLDFVVAKTDIRPEFGRNAVELAKIDKMMGEIVGNDGINIRGISIAGYASPEGTLEGNKRLSEGRARALQSYLELRNRVPKKNYSIHFGGEDWAGLVKQVKASDMKYKQEVLDIIDNYTVENGRKNRLMQLAGGEPYRYMLKEMYPSLRRVMINVDYEVKSFTVEEAAKVIKTRPQDLSLNEMYLVANTYERGSKEFNDVFDVAVRMFPNDETANLNAATAALARNDIESAERFLSKIKNMTNVAEYNNNMGILSMLKGDYSKAETYLNAAEKLGLSVAKSNLGELGKKLENIRQIQQLIKK